MLGGGPGSTHSGGKTRFEMHEARSWSMENSSTH